MTQFNEQKEITLDDLAIMANNSFTHVQEEFCQIYERFDGVEQKIDKLESVTQKSFQDVNKRLDLIIRHMVTTSEFELVGSRVERLEEAS